MLCTSSSVMADTIRPFLGRMVIRPSCSSRPRASRMGVRLMLPISAHSFCSFKNWRGAYSQLRILDFKYWYACSFRLVLVGCCCSSSCSFSLMIMMPSIPYRAPSRGQKPALQAGRLSCCPPRKGRRPWRAGAKTLQAWLCRHSAVHRAAIQFYYFTTWAEKQGLGAVFEPPSIFYTKFTRSFGHLRAFGPQTSPAPPGLHFGPGQAIIAPKGSVPRLWHAAVTIPAPAS